MCCELCTYFLICSEEGKLSDTCCPRCPEYADCIGNEDVTGLSSEEELDFL